MFRKRWRQLRGDLGEIRTALDQLERHTDKMQTILMVREPSSAAAAEAYEGLRKQVRSAVSERMAHLAQLVELHSALAHGADTATLRGLAASWLEHAGVARVDDPAHPQRDELYEFVADGGGPVEVLEPAYLDGTTGRLIRPGRARRRPVLPEGEPAQVTAPLVDATAGRAEPAGELAGQPTEESAGELADREPADRELADREPADREPERLQQPGPETTRTER